MADEDVPAYVRESLALLEGGKQEQALEILELNDARESSRADVNLCLALCLDSLSREDEAIPYYRNGIRLGLEGNDLKVALIGLGSSQRITGDTDGSIETLERVCGEFPQDAYAYVFLAITQFHSGLHGRATATLWKALDATVLDSSDRFYSAASRYISVIEKQ